MVATNPGKRSLHDPSLGQHFEATGIGSLYDLQLPCSGLADHERHLFPGIATVSEDALNEWEQSSRPAQQLKCPIMVLNIGRMKQRRSTRDPACRPGCAACDP